MLRAYVFSPVGESWADIKERMAGPPFSEVELAAICRLCASALQRCMNPIDQWPQMVRSRAGGEGVQIEKIGNWTPLEGAGYGARGTVEWGVKV